MVHRNSRAVADSKVARRSTEVLECSSAVVQCDILFRHPLCMYILISPKFKYNVYYYMNNCNSQADINCATARPAV